MKFSLLVLASPYGSESGETAYQFASAAARAGHSIYRVFFFHEGVYHGTAYSVAPQDEVNRVQRWADFAADHGTELVLCVASSVKRGLMDGTEAARHELAGESAHPGFTIAGLGQLVDAGFQSDRLITFGC
jgi:tRNA 2-thiouridine synthesizing protein D